MSRTFQLTSAGSSVLSVDFYPSIELDKNRQYGLGLVGFHTYHAIKNITDINNIIGFEVGHKIIHTIAVPPGAYEIDEINKHIQRSLWKIVNPGSKPQKPEDVEELFNLVANNNTLKCEITSKYTIRFNYDRSMAGVLGFNNTIYVANRTHESPNPVNITTFNLLRLDCNIIGGSYINGEESHTLFYFNVDVEPGYKIVKEPHNIIYLPVTPAGRQYVDNITLRIVNEKGELIDFGQETINIIVELKELN